MTTPTPTLVQRAGSPVVGGVAAQGSQAIGSFVLQYLTAHLLGLAALGRFAVVFAVIVLATAVSSGFIGDSLTVLDRAQPRIRAALQNWTVILVAASALLCVGISRAAGFLDTAGAVAFGLATVAFVLEDLVRRLLMATFHFWRIVVVDTTALVVALAVLGFVGAVDEISLTSVLWALAVGQLVALFVGIALIPRGERFLVRPGSGGMREVASFGVWRALQQGLRALTLALMRVVLLLTVTTTALGGLELARIYMAPTALMVTGISYYLFASYAVSKGSLSDMLRLADATVAKLLVVITLVGGVAVALVPIVGSFFAGDGENLSIVAVAAWAALSATTAGVTPYGQMASVRGRQRAVFAIRLIESAVSLVAMYLVVSAFGNANLAPLALAACALPAGMAIRWFLIRRPARELDMSQVDRCP